MDTYDEANIMAMVVIAIVIAVKTYGLYWIKNKKDNRDFDHAYIATGILGFFLAYSMYNVHSTDIYEVIKTASVYAIGFNGLGDIMVKLGKQAVDTPMVDIPETPSSPPTVK